MPIRWLDVLPSSAQCGEFPRKEFHLPCQTKKVSHSSPIDSENGSRSTSAVGVSPDHAHALAAEVASGSLVFPAATSGSYLEDLAREVRRIRRRRLVEAIARALAHDLARES